MAARPTARDALSKYSVTLLPDMDVLQAIDVLVKRRVAAAPVVNERKELLGILTEKDCLRVLSNTTWGEISGGEVADFMSEPRAVLTPEMSLFEAANAFLETNFPVLPMAADDRLVGRVTRQDVLRRMQAVNRKLDRQREKRTKRLRSRDPESRALAELEASQSPEELAAALERC